MMLKLIEESNTFMGVTCPKQWIVVLENGKEGDENDKGDNRICEICGKELVTGYAWIGKRTKRISCAEHVRPGNISSTVPLIMDKRDPDEVVMYVKIIGPREMEELSR